jgi:FtsH-binding integral membrane protein
MTPVTLSCPKPEAGGTGRSGEGSFGMSLFVRVFVGVAGLLLALVVLAFLLKLLVVAAVIAGLVVAGMIVVSAFRRRLPGRAYPLRRF